MMGDMLKNFNPGPSEGTNASQDRASNVSVVSSVKAELKYLLAEKFSSNSTVKSTALKSIEKGAIVNNICISTRCCLSWFIDVVNDIHNFFKEHNPNAVSFIPSLQQIARPSRATQKLSVCFDEFVSLCSWLDLRERERADVDRMIYRKKMEGSDFSISIIGATSSEDIHSETSATKEKPEESDLPCSSTTGKTKMEYNERTANKTPSFFLSSSKTTDDDGESNQNFTIDKVLLGSSSFRKSTESSSSSSPKAIDTLQQHLLMM